MTYEELHEKVCDAILNKEVIRYGSRKDLQISPFFHNDLNDKLYGLSGEVLLNYILGNDEYLLRLVKTACAEEIDSLIDLVGP